MTVQISNDMANVVAIRRYLHQHPELGLSEFGTSDYVAQQLTDLGYEVTRGLGQTGVVATLKNGTSSRSIGIRADMDALPIEEETGADYASLNKASCMPAGMTATRPCCWVPPASLPSARISTAPSISSSSRPRKTSAAPG
jgi:metal-dependent amidase/aminoacylase/carboxypeptidase family protein